MTLEESRRIGHYRERTMHNEGNIRKMPKKGYINYQERLLRPENGYIEGFKNIGEDDILMKHGL